MFKSLVAISMLSIGAHAQAAPAACAAKISCEAFCEIYTPASRVVAAEGDTYASALNALMDVCQELAAGKAYTVYFIRDDGTKVAAPPTFGSCR